MTFASCGAQCEGRMTKHGSRVWEAVGRTDRRNWLSNVNSNRLIPACVIEKAERRTKNIKRRTPSHHHCSTMGHRNHHQQQHIIYRQWHSFVLCLWIYSQGVLSFVEQSYRHNLQRVPGCCCWASYHDRHPSLVDELRDMQNIEQAEALFRQVTLTTTPADETTFLLDAYNAMLTCYARAAVHDDRRLTCLMELLGRMVDADDAPMPNGISYAILISVHLDRHEIQAAKDLWQALEDFASVQPAFSLTSSSELQEQYKRLQAEMETEASGAERKGEK